MCCGHALNYDEELVDAMYPGAARRVGSRNASFDCDFLAARSSWNPAHRAWTRAPWKRKMASREVLRGAFDTIQRQSHAGNLLEIQEIRHDRKASASAPASPCGVGLRTGWGAVRACDCDPRHFMLNCAGKSGEQIP